MRDRQQVGFTVEAASKRDGSWRMARPIKNVPLAS